MSAVARTRLLEDTALSMVNRTATPGTITKNKLVGKGTATGTELAMESLDVAGASLALGVIQDDVASGAHGTVFGPGSIVALESSGDDVLAFGDEVIAVAGASLAASGRVKKLPTASGTYYVVGKVIVGGAATAGLVLLVRLVEVRKIIVA